MIFENWYRDIRFNNKTVTGEINITEKNTELIMKEFGYSVAHISCDVKNIFGLKTIEVNLNIKNEGCKINIYAEWHKNGKAIFKEYINNQSTLRIPLEADLLRVSILAQSDGKGRTVVSYPEFKKGKVLPERKARVGAICLNYGFVWEHKIRTCEDNLRESLSRIDAFCREAKPDIIVLTENFYTRKIYTDYDEGFILENSEPIKKMQDKAKEHGIYLSFSYKEKSSEGYYYNTAILIDRCGKIAAKYHKSHLTMNEKIMGMKPGNEVVVVDTDFGKVGIAICWDLFFPCFTKLLADKGAEIIINPSAGYHYDMNRIRAKDNGVYIVTAGMTPDKTVVINPRGDKVSDACLTGAAYAELDLNEIFPVKYLSCNSYAEQGNVYRNEARNDMYIYI